MNKKGLVIFLGIPVITITSLLFINNSAFLGGQGNQNMNNANQSSQSANTVVPTDTEFIPMFFDTINEKNMAVLLGMLDPKIIPDQNTAQKWQDQFNSFEKADVTNIEPADESNWTEDQRVYKVTISTKMTKDSATADVPYYGWAADGENTKWITVIKGEDGLWRVLGIASGL